MRQVFTSPRLENVEAVERLLNEAGIATRVTQQRSYKEGSLRRNFSYREGANRDPDPAVWVLRAEELVRAREILRQRGLLDSTRPDSYLPQPPNTQPGRRRDGHATATRIRMVLFGLIGLVLLLMYLTRRH
jgi:hypothetical protein